MMEIETLALVVAMYMRDAQEQAVGAGKQSVTATYSPTAVCMHTVGRSSVIASELYS
jgi:hypothetical protein